MSSLGNPITLSYTFPSAPADPAGTVTLTLTSPVGLVTVIASGSLTHTPNTGIYAYTFTPTVGGVWQAEWVAGAGAGQADSVQRFVVEGPTTYANLQDMRDYGVPASITDAIVEDRIELSSRIVDDFCVGHSPFGAVLRTVTVNDVRDQRVLLPQPFAPPTQVAVNGSVLAQAGSTVQASPTPTTTTFSVAPGDGGQFGTLDLLYVGGVAAQPLSVIGDAITLAAPLPLAPTAGATVMQTNTYSIEPWGIRLIGAGYYGFSNEGAYGGYGSGWRGVGQPYGARVEVTTTFGSAVVLSVVREATRMICARRLQALGEMGVDPRVQALSVEGYSVRFQPHTGPEIVTTGVPEADNMLLAAGLREVVFA